MKKVKAKVYGLDVWGNKDDGFEVNDSWIVRQEMEFDLDSDASILEALKDTGILSQDCMLKDIIIDGDDMIINVDEAGDENSLGMPIVRLEIIE